MNTFPPPTPQDRLRQAQKYLTKKNLKIVGGVLAGLIVFGAVFGEDPAAPADTTVASTSSSSTSTTSTTTTIVTQADKEREFSAWVETEYYGAYDGVETLKAVKLVCQMLAKGDTATDVIYSIMGADLTRDQMMDMATILGTGVREVCPEWAWKLTNNN